MRLKNASKEYALKIYPHEKEKQKITAQADPQT
jgi:hypothetical protein